MFDDFTTTEDEESISVSRTSTSTAAYHWAVESGYAGEERTKALELMVRFGPKLEDVDTWRNCKDPVEKEMRRQELLESSFTVREYWEKTRMGTRRVNGWSPRFTELKQGGAIEKIGVRKDRFTEKYADIYVISNQRFDIEKLNVPTKSEIIKELRLDQLAKQQHILTLETVLRACRCPELQQEINTLLKEGNII